MENLKINELTGEQVIQLRKEIYSLLSPLSCDFENSFGIDANMVGSFFDGYVNYLIKLDGGGPWYLSLSSFFEAYDTKENLLNYFEEYKKAA